jgi:hypothetical protein
LQAYVAASKFLKCSSPPSTPPKSSMVRYAVWLRQGHCVMDVVP